MSALPVGYARCSTGQQDLSAQRGALLGLGVEAERIYVDQGLTGTNREPRSSRQMSAFGQAGYQTGCVQVSRIEVAEVADRVLSGLLTREAAARWAGERHVTEQVDPVVEDALDILTGIDALQVSADMEPTGYLFYLEDLRAVRARLA